MRQELLVNVHTQEIRVAMLRDGILDDFFVERRGQERLSGYVYKGTINSVVRGMGAAFVDIGLERNGFLYVLDIVQPSLDQDVETDNENGGQTYRRGRRSELPKIESVVSKGQAVMVQIVKEAVGTKGPRLTTQISLPGRYVVLMPFGGHNGVSKRIEDEKERARLRGILKELKLPDGMGVIVRTVSQGRSQKELSRDIRFLQSQWKRIQTRNERRQAPALLHEEQGLVLRVVRDYFNDEVERLVVDSKQEYKSIIQFLNTLAPHLKGRVELFRGKEPLFDAHGVESQIATVNSRRVELGCGGHIVIEHTEGLTAIDVNSGKFTGRRNLEETVFRVNQEAAVEVARQIRMRDIGGIIVIDFIDMESAPHRREVFRVFQKALDGDKARLNILSISEIGVVEMTRQRLRQSYESVHYEECHYCAGRGMVKSPLTVSIEVGRQIERHVTQHRSRAIDVFVHPCVVDELLKERKNVIEALERSVRCRIFLHEDPEMHVEDIRIANQQRSRRRTR